MNITDHAYQMAKERFRYSKDVLDKLAAKALEQGIRHSDTVGKLHKYIDKIWFSHRTANNVRIYGEVIYLFHDETLITVYQLPNNLRAMAKAVKKKKIILWVNKIKVTFTL